MPDERPAASFPAEGILPPRFFSINAVLCERVLREADSVLSAIRIVDVFYVKKEVMDTPDDEKKLAIVFYVLVNAKLAADDDTEHVVAFHLIRPDGESREIGIQKAAAQPSKFEAPRGFNFIVEINVVPQFFGTHFIGIVVDGKEIGRLPFTLVERDEKEAQPHEQTENEQAGKQ